MLLVSFVLSFRNKGKSRINEKQCGIAETLTDKMNEQLIESLLATGGLCSGQEYDFDFDHQFIQTDKYDAKRTYKKFIGYSPGVAVVGNNIVGIENRDGNANVHFCQQHTLESIKTFVCKYISDAA